MAVNAANLVSLGGASSGLRLLDRQIFTASGTWTKPANNAGNILAGTNKTLRIYLIGGGASGVSYNMQMGGGGGGLTEKFIDISQAPATASVTIGAGGSGASGGSTTFGSLGFAGGGKLANANTSQGGGGSSPGGGSFGMNVSGYFSEAIASAGGGVGGSQSPVQGARPGGDGGSGAGGAINTAGSAGLDYGPGGGGGGGSGVVAGAGGLYGGGGGGGNSGAGAGAQGVAVIEVYG